MILRLSCMCVPQCVCSYDQALPVPEDYTKEPPPAPAHLSLTLLNVPPSVDAAATLPRPQHVVLNHTYCQRPSQQVRAAESFCSLLPDIGQYSRVCSWSDTNRFPNVSTTLIASAPLSRSEQLKVADVSIVFVAVEFRCSVRK